MLFLRLGCALIDRARRQARLINSLPFLFRSIGGEYSAELSLKKRLGIAFARGFDSRHLHQPNFTAMRIHRHRMRKPKYDVPSYAINEEIKAETVRVIGGEDEPLGILKTTDAVERARVAGYDLVEVSPKAEPPVCRFIDYGAFKYQKEKEARKAKAQSKEVEVKGIRLTVRIGPHDFDVRKEQAFKFLERGDKLKLEMVLRGREKAHSDLGREVMTRFVEAVKAKYPVRIEQPFSAQGGRLTMIVARV